jgi:RND superfamily putative drug exporter
MVLLAFVVFAGVVGGPVAGRLNANGGFTPADSESARTQVDEVGASVVLLVRDGDPAAAARELQRVPGIAKATVGPTARDQTLVTGTLRPGADGGDVADAALAAFDGRDDVLVGGQEVGRTQLAETIGKDLGRAEMLAFPLLALLSLLFFRGRAAALPLVVGVTTVLGTFLVLTLVNLVYGLNVFALNLVIGLGLGLAIDYTLFMVTRFREELARGTQDPVAATMRSAGRTVAFSAATVAAALGALTLFPLGFAQSMGIAGASVALVAGVASLAISPALLALWGRKLARATSSGDGWHRFAHAVMRRPGVIATVTAALMLAVALPAVGAKWTPIDESVIPQGLSGRTVADALERDFGGASTTPVKIAVNGEHPQAVAEAVRGVDGVRSVSVKSGHVGATVPGDPAGETARSVVHDIRALPMDVAVAGPAAEFIDQQAAISGRLPVALLALAGLTFALLWLMTGSVVLPLKAIVMNALTVAAALAPLVLIYQGGHLEGLLGYTSNGGIEPTDFLVTAALVFALSTDYGVFLLGRIKEARDGGLSEREAVATGIARTGRVVTAAAILLAVAIGAFSTSSISFIQQIGIAVAFGVLIDAFVVRSLLVPSLMALLGTRNWWSPRPLRRLHARVGIGEAAVA